MRSLTSLATGVRALAVAAGAVAAGCGSGGTPDTDLVGLVASPPPPPTRVEVERAARAPEVLSTALSLPWSRAVEALGDHRLVVESTVEVREGATVLETLTDTLTLDQRADGAYHATYDNSADYGREVVWLDDRLYLRPRYARWHGRAAETSDEPAQLRDQMASTLGAYFDLVAHGTELTDRGAVREAGRAARQIDVKTTPSPRDPTPAAVTQRAWRDHAVVDAVTGQVVLDDATGLPLRAQLDGTVGFVRAGKRLTMQVTVRHTVSPTLGAQVVAPPDDQVVATPERLPEVDDRNQILQGIAPPIGKAGAQAAGPAPEAAP